MAHPVPARLSAPYTAAAGRKFGITVGAAFAILSLIARWRGHPTSFAVLGSLGIVLIGSGLLIPALLGPVDRGWMRLAFMISKVTTPVFMAVVYYVILMPVGLLRRTFSKSPLVHHPGPTGFWLDRSEAPRSTLDRQF
ncbi:MAG: hypothetical protein ABI647_17945 [Gemmatimonadota bacterium]